MVEPFKNNLHSHFKSAPNSIQVMVLWAVMPCSDEVEHQCFGGICCLHPQGEVHILGLLPDIHKHLATVLSYHIHFSVGSNKESPFPPRIHSAFRN